MQWADQREKPLQLAGSGLCLAVASGKNKEYKMAEEKKQDLGKTQPGLNEEKDKANQDIGTGRSSGSSDMPEKGSSQGAE